MKPATLKTIANDGVKLWVYCDSFTLIDGEDNRTIGLVGATFSFNLSNTATVKIGYDGEFNEDLQRHNANAGLRVAW